MELSKMTRSELRRELDGKSEEWQQETVAALCGELTKLCLDEPITAPVVIVETASLIRMLNKTLETE